MKSRKWVLAAVLLFLGLPVGLALVEAVTFQVRNRNNGAIISSGQEREYLLHVPQSYDRTRPTPLVISLHGGGMWPAAQRETSSWNRVADENGFLVVYPSGTGLARHKAWRVDPGPALAKDVRFIAELIDTLQASYNVDPARIYANGLSNGGGMSFVLSCTLADRIAAVGMVGAAHLTPWSWCTEGRPMPMIAFHGTADRQALYQGGTSWLVPETLPDIRAWTANWAIRNRCGAQAAESGVAADVTRLEYPNCAGDAAVVLYTVLGGGHTWPGGGPCRSGSSAPPPAASTPRARCGPSSASTRCARTRDRSRNSSRIFFLQPARKSERMSSRTAPAPEERPPQTLGGPSR